METISVNESAPAGAASEPTATVPTGKRGNLEAKAAYRAKKVALASRGRLPKDVLAANLEDDTLLSDVTMAAKDHVTAGNNLTAAIEACIEAGIERDDVIEAIVAGGWAESTARSRVSILYCGAGKRVNKPGQGAKVPIAAVGYAKYMLEHSEDRAMAIKLARAALRYLVAEGKREDKANGKAKAAAPTVAAA